MAEFREGFQTGTQVGGFGKFFETLSGELTKAQKRREEEDVRRRKEDQERKIEEFKLQGAIEKIVETGKQQRETETLKGKEERITKREFPPAGARPPKITATDVKQFEKVTPVPFWERLWPGAQSAAGKERVGIREQFKAQFQPGGGIQPTRGGNKIRVKRIDTGQTGTIEESEFDPAIYERL